jgi:hypothetical protein
MQVREKRNSCETEILILHLLESSLEDDSILSALDWPRTMALVYSREFKNTAAIAMDKMTKDFKGLIVVIVRES